MPDENINKPVGEAFVQFSFLPRVTGTPRLIDNPSIYLYSEEEVEVLYSETSGGPANNDGLAMALGPFLGGLLVLLLLLVMLFPIFGYTYAQ